MLNDSGMPTLQKRGYKMPESEGVVVNDQNMEYVRELGTQVVGLEWFLGRDHRNIKVKEEGELSLSD